MGPSDEVLLYLKMETELASETSCIFKKLGNGQSLIYIYIYIKDCVGQLLSCCVLSFGFLDS